MSSSKGCSSILLVTEMIQICIVTVLLANWESSFKFALSRSSCSLWSCCHETYSHFCPRPGHRLRQRSSANERTLSFQGSFTKRHHARSRYRRSNPNPPTGSPSPTLSVHSLNLGLLSLYHNRHIHYSVSVLILVNLDVLGLLVHLLLDDGFRFSARSS